MSGSGLGRQILVYRGNRNVSPVLVMALVCAVAGLLLFPSASVAEVAPVRTYAAPGSVDQDDMAIWVHPSDLSRSTIVGSDKDSGEVYVYDLDGAVLQTIFTGMPGNVDVRYGIPLGGECVDLIAFNERDEQSIRVYRMDPRTRLLERVDGGTILTGENYGLTLFKHDDGSLYAVTGPKGTPIMLQQYLLADDGQGQITGTATDWQFQASITEGMVGDDETGQLYLAEENVGIWRVAALDATDATLIAAVGDDSGLAAEVEGIAIYHAANGQGYLIASSQNANKFTVLDRQPPHAGVGEFTIDGVGLTDGIDVLNLGLDDTFAQGIFTFHNGQACCPIQAARWEEIAADVGGLLIDTGSWDPRRRCGPFLYVSKTGLDWTAAAPATSYDVVQGELATLLSTGGDFAQSTLACLADDVETTSLDFAADLPAGAAHWYLVRGVAAFGAQTYDSYEASQTAPRDAGIEAAPLSCP